MSAALPRPASSVNQSAGSTLSGLLAHLDAVYAFAHALTSDESSASELTERVYRGVTRDLWSTLGGHGLRDRLLARCLAIFKSEPHHVEQAHDKQSDGDVLAVLPLDDRAAVALVDRLGLTYAAGSAVLEMTAEDFRTALHRGRGVLTAATRRATAW